MKLFADATSSFGLLKNFAKNAKNAKSAPRESPADTDLTPSADAEPTTSAASEPSPVAQAPASAGVEAHTIRAE